MSPPTRRVRTKKVLDGSDGDHQIGRANGTVEDRLRRLLHEQAGAGEPLPSEPALAELLQVSRPHLREALARLEHEGLIYRRQGAQSAVNLLGLQVAGRLDRQVDFAELLADAGHVPTVETLRSVVERLGPDDAPLFATDADRVVLRSTKRWRADGRAVMLSTDVLLLPEDADGTDELAASERSVFELAAELWAEPMAWQIVVPAAVSAGSEEAGALEIAAGTPLLALETSAVTARGRRVITARERHLSGAVRFGFVRSFRDPPVG